MFWPDGNIYSANEILLQVMHHDAGPLAACLLLLVRQRIGKCLSVGMLARSGTILKLRTGAVVFRLLLGSRTFMNAALR